MLTFKLHHLLLGTTAFRFHRAIAIERVVYIGLFRLIFAIDLVGIDLFFTITFGVFWLIGQTFKFGLTLS